MSAATAAVRRTLLAETADLADELVDLLDDGGGSIPPQDRRPAGPILDAADAAGLDPLGQLDATETPDEPRVKVTFELPLHVWALVRRGGRDPDVAARDALVIDLWRQGQVSEDKAAVLLNLSTMAFMDRVERDRLRPAAATQDEADELAELTGQDVEAAFAVAAEPEAWPGD